MSKPVVHYKKRLGPLVVGASAFVWPVDHPNYERVSNTKFVQTSAVVEIGDDGEFFTMNTHYKPITEQ